MNSFLSREQEFLKINEQLDTMAKYGSDKPASNRYDTKYGTYTKRGPTLSMRGPGGYYKPDENQAVSIYKEKTVSTLPKDTFGNGTRRKFLPKDRTLVLSSGDEKKYFAGGVMASSPRSSIKGLPLVRNIPQQNGPLDKTGSNVIVRYKNNSFTQSPSLEVLVKEENESIRSHATSRSSEVSGCLSTARTKANISSEGAIKFLKSRITILQGEHETLTREMTNQKELIEASVERQRKIENQRDAAYSKNNTLVEQVTKLELQLEEALSRLKDADMAHGETRRELDMTKREVKMLSQTNTNLEKRLYRVNEELENVRNTLNQLKISEKEIKENLRNDTDIHEKQIKALKKQRADLLNAYKKQLFLIDNLKRQNMCMEQSRMIAFGEKEFTKVLDWSMQN